MVIAKYTRIVCTLLVFGGCVLQDPPALPDPIVAIGPTTRGSRNTPRPGLIPVLILDRDHRT